MSVFHADIPTRGHARTSLVRAVRWCILMAVLATVLAANLGGCAILAGGAAGAATGYVAGRAARD